MKNLPEDTFWKSIKTQLENYSEQPRDDWDKIAAVISKARRSDRWGMASDIFSWAGLAILLLLPWMNGPYGEVTAALADAIVEHPQTTKSGTFEENEITCRDKSYKPEVSTADQMNSNRDVSHKGRRLSGRDASIIPQNKIDRILDQGGADRIIKNEKENIVANILSENKSILIAAKSEERFVNIVMDTVVKTDSPRVVLEKKEEALIKPHKEGRENKNRKKFRPSLYAIVTPFMTYQKIEPIKGDDINVYSLESPGIFSAERFGWSGEMGFQMGVHRKIDAFAALSYYQQDQTISYRYHSSHLADVWAVSDRSYSLKAGEVRRGFGYTMKNVGVSLGFLYKIQGEKLIHKMGAGIQYQRGLSRSSSGGSYDNSSSNYIGYQLIYRMEYGWTSRMNFFIQPTFIRSIVASEELKEPFTIKPYRAGIGFGVVYHF
ncbi:MAG: hypothetical protein ACOYXT_21835 [Bacteroidota bacterium]